MSDQLPVGISMISQVARPVTITGTLQHRPVAKVEVSAEFKTLKQLEIEHIELALSKFKNNKSKTAIALGITVKTLYNKLHEHGLFEKYQLPRNA